MEIYTFYEKKWIKCRKLIETFTAENFDANFITDLALKAGMKYITITSKHHDGFCLFETKQTDFNSFNSPCGRDLIGELYKACEEKGLGLFLFIIVFMQRLEMNEVNPSSIHSFLDSLVARMC